MQRRVPVAAGAGELYWQCVVLLQALSHGMSTARNQHQTFQSADQTWPVWPKIAGTTKFQASGSRKH